MSRSSGATAASWPSMRRRRHPAPSRRATGVALNPAAVAGPARPIAGPILSVGGRTVRLFGVRPADAREHCGPGSGVAASCVSAANAALSGAARRQCQRHLHPAAGPAR